ncbi:hypothetical protein [Brachybacterium paraconglomeratum]|uniref:hypothetical protein n=1 Tax=Brachybacterium paraconglomeratum TaxID=173362 RepID=UPI0031EDEECA
MKKKMLALPAMAATALIVLSGCSVVIEDGPKNQEPTAQGTTAPVTTEPSDEPTEVEETAAPEASDGGDQETEPSDGGSDQETESKLPPLKLTPDEGTLYLRAVQAFSPRLESWVLNEAGDEVHFVEYNCTGQAQHDVYGTLTDYETNDEGEFYTVTWQGPNPQESSTSRTDALEITERIVVPKDAGSDEIASAGSEAVLNQYVGMCKGAGEMAVTFLL